MLSLTHRRENVASSDTQSTRDDSHHDILEQVIKAVQESMNKRSADRTNQRSTKRPGKAAATKWSSVLPSKLRNRECSCRCHLVRRWYTRKQQFVGDASVAIEESCGANCCPSPQVLKIRINYALPRWLASRLISVYYSSTPKLGPLFSLRAVRICPVDAPIFQTLRARQGSEHLHRLMKDGISSPYDVDPDWNTPLHVRKP